MYNCSRIYATGSKSFVSSVLSLLSVLKKTSIQQNDSQNSSKNIWVLNYEVYIVCSKKHLSLRTSECPQTATTCRHLKSTDLALFWDFRGLKSARRSSIVFGSSGFLMNLCLGGFLIWESGCFVHPKRFFFLLTASFRQSGGANPAKKKLQEASCLRCGSQMASDANFCRHCGQQRGKKVAQAREALKRTP